MTPPRRTRVALAAAVSAVLAVLALMACAACSRGDSSLPEPAGRRFLAAGFGILQADCSPATAPASGLDCEVSGTRTASPGGPSTAFVLARFSSGGSGSVAIGTSLHAD